MAWTDPRTWVVGEVVTAAIMNQHVRDQFLMIGPWSAGDLKASYATHANATTSTLTEPQTGWYIANGATISSTTDPALYAAIGNVTTLPDYRNNVFVPPGPSVGARGTAGGSTTVTLALAQIPVHAHSLTDNGHAHGISDPGHYHSVPSNIGDGSGGLWRASEAAVTNTDSKLTGVSVNSAGTGMSVQNAGSGNAHDNMQPYRVGGMMLIKR